MQLAPSSAISLVASRLLCLLKCSTCHQAGPAASHKHLAVAPCRKSLNEDERVLVAVSLQGQHAQGELQRRAGLLLALSWDPLKRKGIT